MVIRYLHLGGKKEKENLCFKSQTVSFLLIYLFDFCLRFSIFVPVHLFLHIGSVAASIVRQQKASIT